MKAKTICITVGTLVAGSALLFAAEAWETKDPSQWSSEDISKIMNDSPWAKHVTASAQQGMGQRGGGRRMGGGMGLPGGMGGGYPGGGGGYPGGGGGYGGRGGGGYPGSDDGSGSGGGVPRSLDATLRWESALPVQLAEQQRHSGAQMDDDAKKTSPDGATSKTESPEDKPYVLLMVGLQIPRANSDPNASTDDSQSGSRRGASRSPEALRQQFLQNTRILRKSKSALNPSDVKLDADRGEVSFFFRRDEPIDLDDKEVTFETSIGRMKVEKKFKVKDMMYKGKLAL